MFKYNKDKNEYISEPNKKFLAIAIISIIFTVTSIIAMYGLVNFESSTDESSFPIFYGLVFISLVTLAALSGAISNLIKYKTKVTINDDGVIFHSILKSKFICWNEIKDYGLSYYDKDVYILFFSKDVMPINNYKTKKFKRKSLIKYYISSDDYKNITTTVIPFCINHSEVEPFIPII